MNKKKNISIFIALVMMLTFAFASVTEAATKLGSESSTKSVKSGDYMYYAVYNHIYKVNVKTKKITLVYKNNKTGEFSDLIVKDGWIYCVRDAYTGGTSEQYLYIFKVRTNGKNAQTLTKGHNPVIHNGSIYYVKKQFIEDGDEVRYKNYGIYKMSLSGKNDKCIKKSSTMNEFIIYKSNIYYVNSSKGVSYVRKMSLSGKSTKIMTSNKHYTPDNLRAYSDYIYFNSDGGIYKIKTTSTKKILVLSHSEFTEVSDGYIYYNAWIDEEHNFYRMKLSNKSKTLIFKNIVGVVDTNIGGSYMISKVYYDNEDEYENTAKYLCNTNGKNKVVLKRYFTS